MYPLLLLPGLMNDARVWQSVVTEIEYERTCVISPTHQEEGVENIAAAAIRTLPSGPFCVAGFSLGGYVALEVFRQATDRIRGLALLSTGGRSENDTGAAFRRRMIDAARSGGDNFASAAQSFLPRVLHPEHLGDAAISSVLVDMARTVGSEGFVLQQLTAMNRPDSLVTLEQVHVPTLILCGLEDQIAPATLSQEMARKIKDVELVILPTCGHMVTLEQPCGTLAAMRRGWSVLTQLLSQHFTPKCLARTEMLASIAAVEPQNVSVRSMRFGAITLCAWDSNTHTAVGHHHGTHNEAGLV
jgi:pimeloyl-ACP methyl ester carboxylesterase